MNKRQQTFLIYLLSAFCLNVAWSQEVQVSEPIDIAHEVDYTLIGRYKNQVLLYREAASKFFIQSFDKDLKENWVKTIAFDRKDVTVLQIIPHKKSFFILYYFQKKGNTFVKGKEFDTEAQEIDAFDVGRFDEPLYIYNHQVVSSKDKNTLLIYSVIGDNNLEVINFDLPNKVPHWQTKLNFPSLNYYKSFEQILVNNAGETFVVYNKNNTKRKRKQHQFSICKISTNVNFQFHEIPFYGYLSYDMIVQYDEVNQRLVTAGLYASQNSLANGIFYFHTDLKSAPTIQTSELEESFMRSLTGKKKKKITGIHNFIIAQLILRKDGGALLVAEQRFVYESASFVAHDDSRTQTDYLYENILIASIHPSGKVYWKDVLYKSQSSENDDGRYSSFFVFKTNSNLRFLYNNDISWDTSIFEYVVSGKGHVKRNVVKHQEIKDGILPQLRDSIQVSAHEVFALSERDDKLRLLKILY